MVSHNMYALLLLDCTFGTISKVVYSVLINRFVYCKLVSAVRLLFGDGEAPVFPGGLFLSALTRSTRKKILKCESDAEIT
jgi:hypothetical protein